MRTARPLLRLLAVILRVAALVVVLPVLAHAHAVHDHAGHDRVGRAKAAPIHGIAHTPSVAAVSVGPASAVLAASAGHEQATCLGCPGCCCGHVFVAAPDTAGLRADRPGGRRVAMGPEAGHPGAGPEAIPEPPRPFA